MTHPASAFQKNHFLYPRTANDAYGIFAVKEVQRQNELIRNYLKDVYDTKERPSGVTTNAEYGSYMHVTADQENPMRQNWHIDYPDCPENTPRQTPRQPVLPPLVEKHSRCEPSDNISLPPLSYRNQENENGTTSPPKSPRKSVNSDNNGHTHRPKPPLPPTKDFNEQYAPKPAPPLRMIPSPPLPPTERMYEQSVGQNTPRNYCRKNRPAPPLPPLPDEMMLSSISPRQSMRYQSSENTPRQFPPVYYNRPPPPESSRGHNPEYIHLGTTRVPFSNVEAVELHLKDRSSLIMNVDELKKRYIC